VEKRGVSNMFLEERITGIKSRKQLQKYSEPSVSRRDRVGGGNSSTKGDKEERKDSPNRCVETKAV